MPEQKVDQPCRRDVLAMLIAASGSTLVPTAGQAGAPAWSLLDHARTVGVAVLKTGLVHREPKALLARLERRGIMRGSPEAMIRCAVEQAASEDFRCGDTVRVEGILLSRTEAEAFAYVVISHDISFR